MKHPYIKLLFTALISMACTNSFAHDIEVANADGVTIYYNFINDNTELAVTYRGSSNDEYADEYSDNVVIPKTVTYNGNTYSVTSIGGGAFQFCSSLTSVTIPNSVTNIVGAAFWSCRGLTSVTIPNSVTSIGSRAFFLCSRLTSITIPYSVTSIGESAFEQCSSLTSVHISDLAAWCNISFTDVKANPLNCAHHLYLNGEEVKDLIIPESVTSIGNYAFDNCRGLTSVTIPNSVTSIGAFAFDDCRGLTSVTIPNTITSIVNGTFENCINLTSVTIPNSVTSIKGFAFYGCSSLIYVKVEKETPPSIGASYTFSNCTNATLYVPRGSKDAYENATRWTDFKEIVEYDPITVLDDNSEDGPPSYGAPMDVKVQRTIKGGEWSTICLPFAMTGTQVSEALGSVELADFAGYQVTKIGDKTTTILVNFTPVDASAGMEANHPYLIQASDDIAEFSVQEVILAPDEENAQTAFTITEDEQEVTKGHFRGTYHAKTVVPADNLFISANKFYYSTGKTKMQAYRAYFDLADKLDSDQAASAKVTFMFNESSTDRIENLEVQPATSSAVFDLGGRKVADNADGIQRLPKGVYIVNGKKIVR